jgi:hypothetical protein
MTIKAKPILDDEKHNPKPHLLQLNVHTFITKESKKKKKGEINNTISDPYPIFTRESIELLPFTISNTYFTTFSISFFTPLCVGCFAVDFP